MEDKIVLYTFKYLWTLSGEDNKGKVNFKVVTDTLSGLIEFEKEVLKMPNLERFGREYIQEYDCSRICKFDSIKGVEGNEEI